MELGDECLSTRIPLHGGIQDSGMRAAASNTTSVVEGKNEEPPGIGKLGEVGD